MVFSGFAVYFDILQDRLSKGEADMAIKEAKEKELAAEQDSAQKTKRIEATAFELEKAKRDLDETKRAVEAANRRAEALEEKQRDRAISPEQHERFKAFLKPFPTGKVEMRILIGEQGEPSRYASLLKTLLEEAGFNLIPPMNGIMVTGDISGLCLKVKSAENPPAHVRNLQKAFETIGIPAMAMVEDAAFPIDSDTVRIYIYKK